MLSEPKKLESRDTTNNLPFTTLFARDPRISRGREIIFGTRLERRFIKYLRNKEGLVWVMESYPYLTEDQILAC